MATTEKLRPARKFGPGYFIKEQMEYRQWGQEDLAEVMGITTKHLNKILQDNQPITLEMAKVLSEVFETTPQYWLNLDANYRLWLSGEKTEKEAQAELKAKIYERMPIRDMIQKRWLPVFSDINELYRNVAAFWGVKELDFEAWDSKVAPLLARKSESFDQYKAAYTYTWYHKAMQVAKTYKVEAYNPERLKEIYNRIHIYSISEDGINAFIRDLNKAGVVFFVLPHLQKTYLDGAAFFVNQSPVIVYTGRYKRIDNFWFTVAHEIAHILYHFKDCDTFYLDNFSEQERNEIEKEADNKAAVVLKHPEIYEALKPRLKYLGQQSIIQCAHDFQVHPAIIIGKLVFEKQISYANQSLFNENVLQKINPEYLN